MRCWKTAKTQTAQISFQVCLSWAYSFIFRLDHSQEWMMCLSIFHLHSGTQQEFLTKLNLVFRVHHTCTNHSNESSHCHVLFVSTHFTLTVTTMAFICPPFPLFDNNTLDCLLLLSSSYLYREHSNNDHKVYVSGTEEKQTVIWIETFWNKF